MKSNPTEGPRLSACIIAFQEEDRIEAAIESLYFCDEVLVVDSRSTDATRAKAAALGARVIERDWPGHVKQKEFTIREAKHDWVLCIDADERISPKLAAHIQELKGQGFPENSGWRMPRCSRYLGRWIRHGAWYPDLQLRLFDRRRGYWGGLDPHDRVELEGSIGRLSGDLMHEPYRAFSEHLSTIEKYTTTSAAGLNAKGKRARVGHLVVNPTVHFLRAYFFKAGFLDGWRGLLMALLGSYYVLLKYGKLMVLQRADEA